MKLSIRILTIIILAIAWQKGDSQVIIVPTTPNSQVFRFDQLFQVNVINSTGGQVSGFLEMTVENTNQQSLSFIRSLPFILQPNVMKNGTAITWESSPQFGNNKGAQIFSETGNLPFGDYIICYRFIENIGQSAIGVNCQERSIRPFGLPELMSPYDGEDITTKHPLLTWRPPLPTFDQQVEYSLVLTELQEGQKVAAAIRNNFPLLQAEALQVTNKLYPVGGLPLEEGKTYVWQVTASFSGVEIGKTDIWTFTLKPQTEKMMANPNSFANLKRKLDASYYQMEEGQIHFKIEERYNADSLTIKVFDVTRQELPFPTLAQSHHFGFNYYSAFIFCLPGYVQDDYYTMEITTMANESFVLRFKFDKSQLACPPF